MPKVLLLTATFGLVAIAAREIGKGLARFKLPYITGYLFAGMLAGSFVLNIVPSDELEMLRFIDELSLGVIAFVAGSEVYIKELRSNIRSIAANTLGIVVAAFILSGTAIFFLTEAISFTQGLPITSRLAVAVLGSTILLALSPASTIAVMQEVRARGPFSRTVLSVTVFMDVIIIVLFAVAVAVADVLLAASAFNPGFLVLLLLDIIAGIGMGIVAGIILRIVLSTPLPKVVKIGLILAVGLGIFVLSFNILDYTHDALPFEIHIEPLLAAMTAGFFVTNFTDQRQHFEELLHDVAPYVYVAFFTLTGISLKLDILLATLPIAVALFATRAGAIFVGSFLGGTIAGVAPRFRTLTWMGFITQAGIALGLAREVAIEFPTLGDAFATMIISVVVLNEIVGPLFLKNALRRVGETNVPEDDGPREGVRDAVIFGIEAQSLTLARQLRAHNWNVCMVDTDRSHVARDMDPKIKSKHVDKITAEELAGVMDRNTDAVVALLPDDWENYEAIALAYEKYGVSRLIARLNDLSMTEKFTSLGTTIVDPASAMVNLLDQAVRAPHAGQIMLANTDFEIVQVSITNPEVNGQLVRDLRLPTDVLFLDVVRNGSTILVNGYTRLHEGDEVTIVGKPASLEAATHKLGY